MVPIETAGQIVGLVVGGFVLYWAGFFTCAMLVAAKRADEKSDEWQQEHWRGER